MLSGSLCKKRLLSFNISTSLLLEQPRSPLYTQCSVLFFASFQSLRTYLIPQTMKASIILAVAGGITAIASPILGVKLGGVTVDVSNGKGLLGVNVATSSAPAAVAARTKTTPTGATTTFPTGLPATFSAPVQGVGILSLENLPALPAVLDKPLSGVLGSVYGLRK
jgi:hypothetical protein